MATGGNGLTGGLGGGAWSAGGSGGAWSAGGSGGAWSAGGSGGAWSAGGSGGAAGLPQCENTRGDLGFGPRPSGAPASLSNFLSPFSGVVDGTSVFSLDAKLPDGWQVSLVDGSLPSPGQFKDEGGLLSGFVQGDRIRVSGVQQCQPFSGCKSYLVVRNAKDDVLVTATFAADASFLPPFADLLGIGLTLEPLCAFSPPPRCYMDEVETWHRVLVVADDDVRVNGGSHSAVTIGGRTYTVWLGEAATVAGSVPVSSACLDAGSFWSRGAVSLTITP